MSIEELKANAKTTYEIKQELSDCDPYYCMRHNMKCVDCSGHFWVKLEDAIVAINKTKEMKP